MGSGSIACWALAQGGRDLILRAQDFREGMDAFLNKRTPNWKGK
jgi:hypothetical protein